MSVTLFHGPLSGTFQPTKALLITAAEITLDFSLIVAPAPATVQWYLEFGADPDPAGDWYRETAEEDVSIGVVKMPEVVRTFMDNTTGNTLAIGTHLLDVQFRRKHTLVRVQIRTTTGDVVAKVTAPFGQIAA